jgi:hypothetical protein
VRFVHLPFEPFRDSPAPPQRNIPGGMQGSCNQGFLVVARNRNESGPDLCYGLKVLRKHGQNDRKYALIPQLLPQNAAITVSLIWCS